MKQIITGIRTEVDIISWCINWMHARIKITQAKANIYHKCFPLHMVVPLFPIRLGLHLPGSTTNGVSNETTLVLIHASLEWHVI